MMITIVSSDEAACSGWAKLPNTPVSLSRSGKVEISMVGRFMMFSFKPEGHHTLQTRPIRTIRTHF